MQFAEVEELVDPAEQRGSWNVIFQVEGVEQGRLPDFLTSHHRETSAGSMGVNLISLTALDQ